MLSEKIIRAATHESLQAASVAYPLKINPRRLMGWIET